MSNKIINGTKLTELEITAIKGFVGNDDFEEGVLGTWHDTGLNEKTAKGVLASLSKKNLISESGINEHFSYTVWYIPSETLDFVAS